MNSAELAALVVAWAPARAPGPARAQPKSADPTPVDPKPVEPALLEPTLGEPTLGETKPAEPTQSARRTMGAAASDRGPTWGVGQTSVTSTSMKTSAVIELVIRQADFERSNSLSIFSRS